MTTTDQRLARIERLLDIVQRQGSFIMTDLTNLQASVDAVVAAAAADRAAAAASAAKVDTAVGLLQALSAMVADLKAQLAAAGSDPTIQAAVDAMDAKLKSASADLTASAGTESAADTALDSAVAANTPAP